MDNILNKAKQSLSDGLERILKKYYDDSVDRPQELESELIAQEVKPTPGERPIDVVPQPIKPKTFPPITWYILRYDYPKVGSRVAMVIIKHGNIKEEYFASEWLKHAKLEPVLGCFIAAVASAVKPESGVEAELAECTS